ncbi:MAG: nuclear transport factor 2 family protein [Alphaproteobacteria bacterium]|nr:nuclear transport factor 2 family protein [Alphaproteobacteria bacterium]
MNGLLRALVFVAALAAAPAALADEAMTGTVLDRHMTAFGTGKVETILSNYAPDAVIVTPGGARRGHAEIKGFFEAILTEFGQPGVTFVVDNRTVANEVAQIVWHAETAKARYPIGSDTFVVRGGKIVAQTVVFDAKPK